MTNQVNLEAFQNRQNTYLLASQRTHGQRLVSRYTIINNQDKTLNRGAGIVLRLLEQNQHLSPTFLANTHEAIKAAMKGKKYLVINGYALCFSDKKAPGGASLDFKDSYFTEGLLQEPIRCEKGHYLERRCAAVWKTTKGDVCPAGKHAIGSTDKTDIVQELKGDIDNFVHEIKERIDSEKNILQRQETLQSKLILSQLMQRNQVLVLQRLSNRRKYHGTMLLTASGKIAVKSFKIVAKRVPFVSFFVGVGCSIPRFMKGDHLKGVVEVASGLIGCWPGIGTGVSIFIDVSMAGHDFSVILRDKLPEVDTSGRKVQNAYKLLDLDPNANLTKQEVDRTWRKLTMVIHSDLFDDASDNSMNRAEALGASVNNAKDVIYEDSADDWAKNQ